MVFALGMVMGTVFHCFSHMDQMSHVALILCTPDSLIAPTCSATMPPSNSELLMSLQV